MAAITLERTNIEKSLCDSMQTAFALRSKSQSRNEMGYSQKHEKEFVSVHCGDVHLLLQMRNKISAVVWMKTINGLSKHFITN